MTEHDDNAAVEQLLDTPRLADALESERFKQFLDHVPFAVAVSELHPSERLTYANHKFEQLTGTAVDQVPGQAWNALPINAAVGEDGRHLSDAVTAGEDYIGTFSIKTGESIVTVDAWSNTIADDNGTPLFRLVALADIGNRAPTDPEALAQKVLEQDTQLRELQHRVKNNLQMITALIRLEARNVPSDGVVEGFDRLAGRVESLALLYEALSREGKNDSIDLGVYLSQVASAVIKAHAPEGIHFNLQVDTWPVSVNVAMPTGLVVNELLTNALKHAFVGRAGGTITLKSVVSDQGCCVTVADDGIGLSEGASWPQRGKLSALIVQSLRENAGARFEVASTPGQGMKVTILFSVPTPPPEPSPRAHGLGAL